MSSQNLENLRKFEENKKESEGESPCSAPDKGNKEVIVVLKHAKTPLEMGGNNGKRSTEERNSVVQGFLKNLPQYDFLFAEKIVQI